MVVDCNTLFGPWQRDCRDTSLAQLLRVMAHTGVDAALTCSSAAVWGDFVTGNAETLRACAAVPPSPSHGEGPGVRFLPVLTVRPLHYLDCLEEIGAARERGFRMIRFFPHQQGWGPRDLCFRRLVEPLVAASLPVFWNYLDEADPLRPIPTLVDYFRGSTLPLVLGSVSYALGEFLAACELHPPCYTDTARLFLHSEIEIIRDEVGIHHVLFGSHAPFDDPAAPLEVVRHSRLTEDEKAAVLGANALRLLSLAEKGVSRASEVPAWSGTVPPGRGLALRPGGTLPAKAGVSTPDPTPAPSCRSPLAIPSSLASSRRGAGGEVIDIHAHIGPWPGLPNPHTAVEDILETCDRYSIERCCLSSTVAIGYDLETGNEETRRVVESQDRLFGYVVIHPGYPELSMRQLHEYLASPKFVGAKLHPKHCGFQADSPEARPLLEYLSEAGKPLLAHTWFADMCQAMANLADALPELTLILGHMGGDDWECALALVADRPNMYLELCSGLAPWGKMERAVAMVGADRLLFGSDLTLLEPGFTLGTVTGSMLSEADQRTILYANAKRLFGW